MFSWIHIEDLFGIIQFIQANKKMKGHTTVLPNPVSNEILMRSLRQAMKVKFGLPSPKFLLEIGAFIIRTETELILKSRWVIPERLMHAGFQFQFSTIDEALRNILIENNLILEK